VSGREPIGCFLAERGNSEDPGKASARLNFLLCFINLLKIDFFTYWISKALHWREKRESAFTLSCFIFCAACIHTFMFARERLKNRQALLLQGNPPANAYGWSMRQGRGGKQQSEGAGLAGFGFDQRNMRN
jgi:hypothetical protein